MSYKDEYADVIAGQFYELENKIMQDIIRRIRKEGKITSTADWQINRLTALGHSSAEIEAIIKDALNVTWPEMFELYDEVIDWEYVRNAKIYEQVNEKFIPYKENEQLQQFVKAAKVQTQNSLVNLTQSLGVVSNINGQITFLPLTEFYKKELDAAVLAITSGAMDYNSVLRKTVNTLANSGIRTIDYASGYNSRLPVAVRRAVMTGVSQLTGQISQMNAQKLGTDYFEVDYHSGARPEHREWQGKVYTMQQLIDVCGLGTATGLNGINCYHEYYPFFPGISERNWTDEWLEEQNRLEDEPRAYRGKEYTRYEALQKQRQMETSMRTQRQKVRLLEEGKADPDDIIIAKARYQGQMAEYKEFSAAMNLELRMNRVYIDGLGRIAPNENKFYRNNLKGLASGKDLTQKFSRPIQVGTVEKVDMQTCSSALRKWESIIRGRDIETAIVISQSGQIYRIDGDKISVNIYSLEEKELFNAYITHNHPIAESNFSFSGEDISAFIDNHLLLLRGVDEEYTYTCKALPETIKVDKDIITNEFYDVFYKKALQKALAEGFDMDKDGYHLICEMLAEKYNFFYERKERK